MITLDELTSAVALGMQMLDALVETAE